MVKDIFRGLKLTIRTAIIFEDILYSLFRHIDKCRLTTIPRATEATYTDSNTTMNVCIHGSMVVKLFELFTNEFVRFYIINVITIHTFFIIGIIYFVTVFENVIFYTISNPFVTKKIVPAEICDCARIFILF